MPKNKKILLLVFVGAGMLIFLWLYFVGFSANRPGTEFNKGHNAVWIGHKWVGEWQSEEEIRTLVEIFENHGIDTIFVHCGPLGSDGSIEAETYKFAQNFLETARQYSNDIEYQAWLGQIRGRIDLAEESVRENVLTQVNILTELAGFDGIHYDIEPVWDEDSDFLRLLKETRGHLGEEKKMSVALAEFIPKSFIWLMQRLHEFKNYNTEINYRNVGEFADQIVVMTYDTGFDDPELYEWLVKEQTVWVTRLYDEKEVFIGLPSYEAGEGFDPVVENIGTGLRGVIRGLNNSRSEVNNFAGVAIYSFWETDEEEWAVYSNLFNN
ncbi:hypothetical protein KJ632_00425 [Patescibacteria group bacterium]|nr:hypothetical protein [Patescibacteria group bacterium]